MIVRLLEIFVRKYGIDCLVIFFWVFLKLYCERSYDTLLVIILEVVLFGKREKKSGFLFLIIRLC